MAEVAQRIEETIKHNELLETRLEEVVRERGRYEEEISRLQNQLKTTRGGGQLEATLAVKEKLMRDELERRVQSLQVEWKQERRRLHTQIEELKREVSTSFLCAPVSRKK